MANRAYDHPVYRAARRRLKGLPCHYCGEPSDTVEHLDPVVNGGGTTNLVPACGSCNYSRGAKLGHERARRRRSERNRRYR